MGFGENKKGSLTIGKLAGAAGVSIETVRYYQRRGLLARPQRPAMGGFRHYGDSDLARLRMIRQAQDLGFTLAEIAELFGFLEGENCDAIGTLAERKLAAIGIRIQALEAARGTLQHLVASCKRNCRPQDCPVIRTLFEAGDPGGDA